MSTKALILLICLSLLTGCSKEAPKKHGYILAGDAISDGTSHFTLNIPLKSQMPFDIDLDGTPDLYFYDMFAHTAFSIWIEQSLVAMDDISFDGDSGNIAVKNLSDTIGLSNNWFQDRGILWGSVDANYPQWQEHRRYGHWESVSSKFIGFKKIKNQKTYYGWLFIGEPDTLLRHVLIDCAMRE